MKKFLTVALLTLAVVALVNGQASAGKCKNCVCFCPAYYNAFSPPCLGIKSGCCCIPFPSMPAPEPAPCAAPVDCCPEGGCLGHLPAPETGHTPPITDLGPAPQAPMPSAVPANPGTSQNNQRMPQGPAQAAYRPAQANAYSGHSLSVVPTGEAAAYSYGVYPGYNYGYGNSNPVAVPSYWNGGR